MALLYTPMLSSSRLLPRKFPPALANIDREGRTKRPEEHANGNKGLGVRGPFVQKAARRHLPALFPFVPYVASLLTLEGTPGFLWHQQLAVLCRRWLLRVCWRNVLPQGGQARSGAQHAGREHRRPAVGSRTVQRSGTRAIWSRLLRPATPGELQSRCCLKASCFWCF